MAGNGYGAIMTADLAATMVCAPWASGSAARLRRSQGQRNGPHRLLVLLASGNETASASDHDAGAGAAV